MNVVYVCKNCPFSTHDYKTAIGHKNPLHQMHRFTEEVL